MTDTVGFSVGAVARRLGVAPSTLRTWNRRYGIGARELSPGRHRRYTAEDIIRLEHMQRLILRGAAPADAARAAMLAPVALFPAPARTRDAEAVPKPGGAVPGGAVPGGAGPGERRPGARQSAPGLPGLLRKAAIQAGGTRPELPARDSPPPGRDRGTAPAASAWRCPVRRPRPAAWPAPCWPSTRNRSARPSGPRWPATAASVRWEELLLPVLSGVGTRFEHTGTCVEAEHLLSMATIAAFSRYAADRPGQREHRAILLASAEGDQHSLPLYALAAALAERGIDSRMLGSDLPYSSLAAAVRRTGPAVVFLWSQVPATGNPVALPDLFPRRPGARLILGGPGWDRDRIPATVRLVGTLPEALSEVVAALGC